MKKTKVILFNITFFFNCLLLFLLFFYGSIEVPVWLQVFGRMHPLLLHFPVVLVILFLAWQLWLHKQLPAGNQYKHIGNILLLSAALTAAVTAVMGILLSKEEGFDAGALALHKWSGSGLAFITFIWYITRDSISVNKYATAFSSLVAVAALLVTGDLGAEITHGENYLLAPVLPGKNITNVALEDAVVYTDMIQPVLQSKCISCHSSKKAKGELIMETAEQLLKGGKDGALFDTASPSLSLLLKRIHLPLEDEKHMPPKGRQQLSDDETQLFYYWIKGGASFTAKVVDLPLMDTLRIIAGNKFKPDPEEVLNFSAASETVIRELNNNNRVITPLSISSHGLSVVFYNAQNYKTDDLKALLKVKEQVVELNLAHMPVKDNELSTIAQFINLRKLNLNFTGIKGEQLSALKTLLYLKELSIAGTQVSVKQLQPLASFTSLKNVYVWNTSLSEKDITALHNKKTDVRFETGFRTDTIVIKLNPPVIQNEQQVITTALPLQLKHYVNGTTIRYTLDGTDPDSIISPVYTKDVILDKNCLLKARAFKHGWISSDITQAYFYKSALTPDSAILLTHPADAYKATGGKTIIDKEKSDLNFRNGKWLGYQGTKMESLLYFNKPAKIQSVTLSSIVDIGSYIMPPLSIEIWGGSDPAHLKLLSRITPEQPVKPDLPFMRGFECNFSPAMVQYLKIVASAVSKLPVWHPGKGEKGWFFTDEVFIN